MLMNLTFFLETCLVQGATRISIEGYDFKRMGYATTVADGRAYRTSFAHGGSAGTRSRFHHGGGDSSVG